MRARAVNETAALLTPGVVGWSVGWIGRFTPASTAVAAAIAPEHLFISIDSGDTKGVAKKKTNTTNTMIHNCCAFHLGGTVWCQQPRFSQNGGSISAIAKNDKKIGVIFFWEQTTAIKTKKR